MIAMRLSTPSVASVRSGLATAVKWIGAAGVAGGLILAVVQCSIERENTRLATVQTYNMGRVAAFRDSGAELDKKVAAFADAASEGRNLSEARQGVRGALADHAARTMAMKDAFGTAGTQAYTTNLKELQSAIEETRDRTSPGPIITALSRVVVARNKLAETVMTKATT